MGILNDDQDIVVKLTEEMAEKRPPMEFVFKPDSAFHLVAVLQLAKRHPHLPPAARRIADMFILHVREYFADCPTVLDVIRRGDDPHEDR